MNPLNDFWQQCQNLALEQGLVYLGASDLNLENEYTAYQSWVDEGLHAGMDYLKRHASLRADPRLILPSARSAVVLGFNYRQHETFKELREQRAPWVSQYARLRDYHRFLRKRCERFMTALNANRSVPVTYRVCVDSVPVLERALAAKCERGFIGKNTMYIDNEYGSFLLLAVILTDVTPAEQAGVSENKDAAQECGTCRRCKNYCPTGALDEEYRLDARKCISYWTIEHRGTIPPEFWPHLKQYVFGCDICQLVCPFNREKPALSGADAVPLHRTSRETDLYELFSLNEEEFFQRFAGTPLMRAGRSGIRRNALIAMAVTQHPKLQEALRDVDQSQAILEDVVAQTAQQIRDGATH